MSTQSEGPGPMRSISKSILWDHDPPHYAIVVPQHRDLDLDGPQMLMEYIGEVKGFNVTIIVEGSACMGYQFDEYMTWGCVPPIKPLPLREDQDPADHPTWSRQMRKWRWWYEVFACRLRGGSLHH